MLEPLILHLLVALLLAVRCIAPAEYFHEELPDVVKHIAHLILSVQLLLVCYVLGGHADPQQVLGPVSVPSAYFVRADDVLVPFPDLLQLLRAEGWLLLRELFA